MNDDSVDYYLCIVFRFAEGAEANVLTDCTKSNLYKDSLAKINGVNTRSVDKDFVPDKIKSYAFHQNTTTRLLDIVFDMRSIMVCVNRRGCV